MKVMNLKITVPEAKTNEELRKMVANILVTGSQYTLIDYQMISFNITEE